MNIKATKTETQTVTLSVADLVNVALQACLNDPHRGLMGFDDSVVEIRGALYREEAEYGIYRSEDGGIEAALLDGEADEVVTVTFTRKGK